MPKDAKDKKISTTSSASIFDAVTERSAPDQATTQAASLDTSTPSRSEKTLQAAQQLLEQQTVIKERFLLEELLGCGGMGAVYKARDLRKVEARDRTPWVAIKLLNEAFKKHPAALISLQREARKSQALAHPNIIQVFDFDRDDDVVFMTMEFLRGGDLNQLIQKNPSGVGLDETLRITREMGSALQHAHENHIIHADFTPRNVFLTDEGKTKVLDFGIAQAIALADTQAGDNDVTAFDPTTLGGMTPAYAGLERLQGMSPVAADDVYGLGCMVYLLLSGTHPYKGRSALEAESLGIRPAKIALLSARQWRALQKAMALPRAERYQSAQEFLQDFSPLVSKITRLSAIAIGSVFLIIGVLGYQSLVNYKEGRERDTELQQQKTQLAAKQRGQDQRTTIEYLGLVDTLLEKDRYDEAQLYLQRIRSIAPQHPQLLSLEKKLAQSRETYRQLLRDLAQTKAQIDRLLTEADEYILAGRLLRPLEASAFASYQEILALDPANLEARALLQRLVQLHLDGADRALRNNNLQGAEILLDDARKIAPANPEIARLEVELKRALAQEQKRTRQLNALLTQAKGLSGEAAAAQRYKLYSEALDMDPDNQVALIGLASARAEISRIELREKQQARKNAAALLLHAQQLLEKRPATPENFSKALEFLLESQRQSPDFSAIASQLEQLPQDYVAAIQREIAEGNYTGANRFLQTAIVLAPQNTELGRLQEELDALVEEEVVVPASF
jgi:serine/threonine protein kinase